MRAGMVEALQLAQVPGAVAQSGIVTPMARHLRQNAGNRRDK